MANKKLDISKSTIPLAETEIVSPALLKSRKEIAKEKLQELIKEETKLVKGIFQCFETPGSSIKITIKKYPGIQPFDKVMTDGEIYEIPLYVARHLNGSDVSAGAAADSELRNPNIGTCSYPVHGFLMKNNEWNQNVGMGAVGNYSAIPVPIVGIAKRVKRFGFQSMEFAGA
mgnify:CR=1 FL=1